MRVATIGFTKKPAAEFFGLLRASGATTLIDVRLNNVSQLAGFSKRDDLTYFLRELCGMEYRHELQLAPTQGLLDAYRKHGMPWPEYEASFRSLLFERHVDTTVTREQIDGSVFLCSEPTAHRCHRRVVAEYLSEVWGDLEIVHL
jgi:uncharacterized protein (DUF488 family)